MRVNNNSQKKNNNHNIGNGDNAGNEDVGNYDNRQKQHSEQVSEDSYYKLQMENW